MKKTYILEDLDCAHCAGKIEEAVGKLEKVQKASLSFLTKKLIVEAEENDLADIEKDIKKIVKKLEPDVTVKAK